MQLLPIFATVPPQIPDQQDHVWTEGKVEKMIINTKLMKYKILTSCATIQEKPTKQS